MGVGKGGAKANRRGGRRRTGEWGEGGGRQVGAWVGSEWGGGMAARRGGLALSGGRRTKVGGQLFRSAQQKLRSAQNLSPNLNLILGPKLRSAQKWTGNFHAAHKSG